MTAMTPAMTWTARALWLAAGALITPLGYLIGLRLAGRHHLAIKGDLTMSLLQRIAREPNAVLGVIVAGYGLLVVFDVLTLTSQQVGGVTAFGGALVVLLRWLVTPASEVLVQQKTADHPPVAGAGLGGYTTGEPIELDIHPVRGDQTGA